MSISSFKMWPNHIVIGEGAMQKIGEHLRGLGVNKVFLVLDSSIKGMACVEKAVKTLENERFLLDVFSDIQSPPTDIDVHKGLKRIQEFGGEAIVVVGGGSALDTAKAINIVHNLGGHITDYGFMKCGVDCISEKLSPLIAVPTTAGTGSEVSGASVLINSHKDQEFFIDSYLLVPDVSILDPEVTLSLPPYITAFTGMDAMTHHIEAYLSNIDSAIADGLCLQGISMIARNLQEAVVNGNNLKAREEMLVASMMGAMAFMQSELGLAHGIALSLSEVARVPHGVGNAMMLPKVVEFNSEERPDRVVRIAEALGVNVNDLSQDDAISQAVKKLELLNKEIGIPAKLSETGVSKNMIPLVVKRTMECPILECNPRRIRAEDVEKMLMSSLK